MNQRPSELGCRYNAASNLPVMVPPGVGEMAVKSKQEEQLKKLEGIPKERVKNKNHSLFTNVLKLTQTRKMLLQLCLINVVRQISDEDLLVVRVTNRVAPWRSSSI